MAEKQGRDWEGFDPGTASIVREPVPMSSFCFEKDRMGKRFCEFLGMTRISPAEDRKISLSLPWTAVMRDTAQKLICWRRVKKDEKSGYSHASLDSSLTGKNRFHEVAPEAFVLTEK